jgi:guanyl-specific ribonuclease Sa
MRRMRWLMFAFLAVMVFMAWSRDAVLRDDPAPRRPVPTAQAPERTAPAPRIEMPAKADALPPEADATLALIAAGGPFPYDRDGVVFGNFEQRLPPRERGWYHEYTVPTPGVDHRGARRIVTGGNPPSEYWYTDDHYGSFRRIEGRQ